MEATAAVVATAAEATEVEAVAAVAATAAAATAKHLSSAPGSGTQGRGRLVQHGVAQPRLEYGDALAVRGHLLAQPLTLRLRGAIALAQA